MRKYFEGAAIAVLMLATAQVAYAADVAPAAPADDATALDNVVVTATKRETNLQNTPIAISVLSATAMADRHAESLISLQDGAIPSLRVATFEARQSALTIGIRGIVPFDANQTARDQGVGVYIDGVYLGRQQGLNAALLDLERIEVLRGPQGTLFGRNTEGGALSIVTKAPTGEFGGRVVAGFGNYGSYTGELHQDFQEFANLSVKVDALLQHQDPTTKNPLEGQAGWNQYDRKGGRISGLYRPNDKFSALVAFDYAKDENTPFFSQLVSYNPYGKRVRTQAEMLAAASAPAGTINPLSPLVKVRTDRQSVSDIGTIQQPSVDETGGLMANLKYRFAPNLELRSITAARAVATNQWDNSGIESRNVFAPNANFGRYSLSDLYQRQFSQEFQLVGDFGDNFTYVGGLYYFKEHVKESAATPFTNQWNADGTAYTIRSAYGTSKAAAGTAGWQRGTRFITRASEADAESYAVYGQGTYTPPSMDALHLTLGGRYTKDTRDGTLYIVNGKATNFKFDYDKGRFDPMINVAYDAAENINLYAKFSTGYRAGGANARSSNFQAFDPETVKSYEVGAKMDLLDNRLRVNLAAYAMDRKDTQIDFDNVDTTPGSPTQGAHTEETRNAPGTSKIRGFEADITAKLTDDILVGFSYAYTDVKVPDAPFPFTGNSVVPQGTPFPVNVVYTPPNAASAYIDYKKPVGSMTFRAHLDANYADAQYSFQTEFADTSATASRTEYVAVKTDSSFIVNGNLTLADISMADGAASASLSLWSRNLLNEEHIYRISAANRGTIGDYANFNPPRTYGLELRVKY
ncbi:TonB-dependent receptor [Caulobacter sp. 602-2]|uniref:TonB-dependent receptor n=1 Tax=Caulobacter sp. 602-2 TaxID=2710887 RepID=A0A6G4QXW4_9CAUL|nr:TonB-dependent receptor [Caulobacter sp. 602-2]NGM50307.1 TonB-dependent receptor [Caulobacter sp. 602-2]